MKLDKWVSVKPDARIWEEVALNCSYATFFHLPFWSAVVGDVYADLRPSALIARDEQSGACVLFPLVAQHSALAAGPVALHLGGLFTYGGPIAEPRVRPEALARLTSKLPRYDWTRTSAVELHGNPWLSMPTPTGFDATVEVTSVVDLEEGLEAVRARYSTLQRRGIRASDKADVHVRIASKREDWLAYFGCYGESLARWADQATSRYPWELFDRMRREPASRVSLWLAENSHGVLAGALVGLCGTRAYYWHGATGADTNKIMPSRKLWDSIFEALIRAGIRTVDLLGSGGHEGVLRFKESLGAVPMEYRAFSWRAGVMRRGLAKALRHAAYFATRTHVGDKHRSSSESTKVSSHER